MSGRGKRVVFLSKTGKKLGHFRAINRWRKFSKERYLFWYYVICSGIFTLLTNLSPNGCEGRCIYLERIREIHLVEVIIDQYLQKLASSKISDVQENDIQLMLCMVKFLI